MHTRVRSGATFDLGYVGVYPRNLQVTDSQTLYDIKAFTLTKTQKKS